MIRVRTLGQNVIEVKRRSIRPDAELLFATLLYLAGERGRRVERETMAALFWPRESAARRRHSLRQILYKLRRLGVNTGNAADGLTIPAADVWLDFEDAGGSEGRKAHRELGAPGGVRCLPDYTPAMSKAFSDWLDAFRARGESAARRRLVAAIAHARKAGRWEEVETLARNCLHLDPLNEEATLALAETMAFAGAKSKAVAMLDAYMAELGPQAGDMKLPASVLRRRIADQIGARRLKGPLETKLIGREDVMEAMTAALEKTKAGHAATHVLWGVSGIGKTRVLEEVTKLAALMGATTVMQRAAPDDQHTPGLTLVRLARAMLAAPGSLGLAPDVLALLQRLTALRSSAEGSRDSDVNEEALVPAIVDLQRALAWERPVLIALDDVHHADELTRRVLSRAQGCLTNDRVLLLLASASQPPTAGHGRFTSLQMRRLTPDACTRLASALIEKAGIERDPKLADSLATASGGHPFVLREAVIAYLRNAGNASAFSVEQILQQRLAALSENARDILLSAIILGEHASVRLLLDCTALPVPAIESGFVELEQEQMLRVATHGAVSIHSLWQASLNALFPAGRIVARRLSIGRVLESIALERGPDAELLVASGLQLQRGGDATSASRVLARGGTALRERGLAPGAAATLTRAATLAPQSSDFEALLFSALRASSRGGMVDETTAMLTSFGDRLRGATALSDVEKAEIELIDVETTQTALGSNSGLVERCARLARKAELTAEQRLRAALAGAMAAEQQKDRAAVDSFAQLAEGIPKAADACKRIADQVSMVHAVSNRRLERALELAERQIAGSANLDANARCRALLAARVPFVFNCDYERVERIVIAARSALLPYPSSYLALRADDAYGTLCIEQMRLDEAQQVLGRTHDSAIAFGHLGLARECAESINRLRVARGEAFDARPQQPNQAVAHARHGRTGMFALCNSVIGLARSGAADSLQQLLTELTGEWLKLLDCCPLDYPCFAIAAALVALGRRNEADALIKTYVSSERVARNPPSPLMLALAREFALATG